MFRYLGYLDNAYGEVIQTDEGYVPGPLLMFTIRQNRFNRASASLVCGGTSVALVAGVECIRLHCVGTLNRGAEREARTVLATVCSRLVDMVESRGERLESSR